VSTSEVQVAPLREKTPSFARWALLTLRCELEPQSDDIWQARLPESLQKDWDGREVLRFCASANGAGRTLGEGSTDEEVLNADASSRLFHWTIEKLRAQGSAAHSKPAGEPESVHEITPAIFAHYRFTGGHIHLAGCLLEDRPIIRLTSLPEQSSDGENGRAGQVHHHLFWPDGSRVDETLAANLHLDDITPCNQRPPHPAPGDIDAAVENVRRQFACEGEQVVAATVIWCKYAQGKLAFEAGEQSVALPFEGWARLLAEGTAKPPPYCCPLSGHETYHLAVTDDGHIAAAEGIATCEESGRRLLHHESEQCAATGRRVAPDLLATCRASGERVLARTLVECSQCHQPVSPNVLQGGRCSVCRSLAPVRKDDPRIARLLDEYPQLDRWPRWRISETEQLYVLVATGWLRQLLLVVDKQSLEVVRVATSGRILTNWAELPSGQREELLG